MKIKPFPKPMKKIKPHIFNSTTLLKLILKIIQSKSVLSLKKYLPYIHYKFYQTSTLVNN